MHVSVIIKSRYIKLTSPLINVLICLGAILMYAEIVFLGIPTEDIYAKTGLCNVRMICMYISNGSHVELDAALQDWRNHNIKYNTTWKQVSIESSPNIHICAMSR